MIQAIRRLNEPASDSHLEMADRSTKNDVLGVIR
jgi:hypothetical protein